MLPTMDSSLSVKRALRRGLLLLSRQKKWGTTLALLSAVLLLTQMLVMFYLGVVSVDTLLSSQAGVRLEVISNAQDQDIQTFFAAAQSESTVSHVAYITKADALEQQRVRDPDLVSFLEQYKLENPFPDSFTVTLKSLDSYDSFRTFIEQDRWRTVINPSFLTAVTDQEHQIRQLLQVTNAMRSVSALFVFAACAVLLFLVLELISRSVRAHEDELFVETMLGASPVSVLLPFMAEMTVLLTGAMVIATLLMFALISGLPLFIPSIALEPAFRAFANAMTPLLLFTFPWIFIVELCLLPVIAYIGTFLGAGRKVLSPVAFFG